MPFVAQAAGFLASFAAAEIASYMLEQWAGDPEATVENILANAKSRAGTNAALAYNQPAEVEQSVGKAFGGIHPERVLTQMAMLRGGQMDITPDNKPVLSYISSKLGMHPQDLMARSSPARMGDFTALQSAVPPQYQEGGVMPNGPQ